MFPPPRNYLLQSLNKADNTLLNLSFLYYDKLDYSRSAKYFGLYIYGNVSSAPTFINKYYLDNFHKLFTYHALATCLYFCLGISFNFTNYNIDWYKQTKQTHTTTNTRAHWDPFIMHYSWMAHHSLFWTWIIILKHLLAESISVNLQVRPVRSWSITNLEQGLPINLYTRHK